MFNYNSIDAETFAFDLVEILPNNTLIYYNGGDRAYHQYAYILSGNATVTVSDTVDGLPIPSLTRGNDLPGTLIDLSPSKDKYTTTTTAEDGISFITFDPVPASKELRVVVMNTPQTAFIAYTPTDSRVTALVMVGTATIEGVSLQQMQWKVLVPGTQSMIVIPPKSAVAIVSE